MPVIYQGLPYPLMVTTATNTTVSVEDRATCAQIFSRTPKLLNLQSQHANFQNAGHQTEDIHKFRKNTLSLGLQDPENLLSYVITIFAKIFSSNLMTFNPKPL